MELKVYSKQWVLRRRRNVCDDKQVRILEGVSSCLSYTCDCSVSSLFVRFVNLLTEDLERSENRERAYGQSQIVNGERQHRNLTLRDKQQTLRMFASRVTLLLYSLLSTPENELFNTGFYLPADSIRLFLRLP